MDYHHVIDLYNSNVLILFARMCCDILENQPHGRALFCCNLQFIYDWFIKSITETAAV